MQISTHLHI